MSAFGDHRMAPWVGAAEALRHALLAVIVLPVALLLQGIGDVLRHVGLVVLGEHGVGAEHARRIERAFGDDALPLAEQIRQDALVGDRQRRAAVGDGEGHREIVAALQRALLHQAAEAETLAGTEMLLGDHRRRREEHDGIAQRVQHQARGDREHDERAADQCQTPLLPGHGASLLMTLSENRCALFGVMLYPSSPRFFSPSLS